MLGTKKLQCTRCGGRLRVYVTRQLSEHVVRYCFCPKCKARSKHVQSIFKKIPFCSTAFFYSDEKPRIVSADNNAIQKGNSNEHDDDDSKPRET